MSLGVIGGSAQSAAGTPPRLVPSISGHATPAASKKAGTYL
jgi:hypothetical protein